MKLRIRGDSIRLRLTRSEVAQLSADGRVENTTSFGTTELMYSVTSSTRERVEADLRDNEITVYVPAVSIADWADSELVGIEGTQAVRDGELHILIEKDFACLKARGGDEEADTFANPLAAGNG